MTDVLKPKVCKVCDTEFQPKNEWQKWCSRKCSDVVRARRYRRTAKYERARDIRRLKNAMQKGREA